MSICCIAKIFLCLCNIIQPILGILSEYHLPTGVLTVAVQLAASLILVSPNVPGYHTHLSPLLKAVCDRDKTNDREEVGIVLAFFQELAQKYPGYEYVSSASVHVCVWSTLQCIQVLRLPCLITCTDVVLP